VASFKAKKINCFNSIFFGPRSVVAEKSSL